MDVWGGFSRERRFGTSTIGLLGAILVFHASVQVLTLGLSILHRSQGQIVALLVLATSTAAGAGFWLAWRDRGLSFRRPIGLFSLPGFVIVFAVVAYLALGLAAYLGGDTSFDGNTYHLPTIHF